MKTKQLNKGVELYMELKRTERHHAKMNLLTRSLPRPKPGRASEKFYKHQRLVLDAHVAKYNASEKWDEYIGNLSHSEKKELEAAISVALAENKG